MCVAAFLPVATALASVPACCLVWADVIQPTFWSPCACVVCLCGGARCCRVAVLMARRATSSRLTVAATAFVSSCRACARQFHSTARVLRDYLANCDAAFCRGCASRVLALCLPAVPSPCSSWRFVVDVDVVAGGSSFGATSVPRG